MKRLKFLLLLLLATMTFPLTTTATSYVNEDAPGVHKEYDRKLRKQVWKDGMGNYLCDVKDSKPLHAIDEDYFAQNITQEGKDLMGVKKVWDAKRGCFVWKDGMGNFLGRDNPDGSSDKGWLSQRDPNWFSASKFPFITPQTQKTVAQILKEAEKANSENDKQIAAEVEKEKKKAEGYNKAEIDQKLREGDAQVREAEQQLKAARAALRQAGASEYEGLLDQAESEIRNYKNKRKK